MLTPINVCALSLSWQGWNAFINHKRKRIQLGPIRIRLGPTSGTGPSWTTASGPTSTIAPLTTEPLEPCCFRWLRHCFHGLDAPGCVRAVAPPTFHPKALLLSHPRNRLRRLDSIFSVPQVRHQILPTEGPPNRPPIAPARPPLSDSASPHSADSNNSKIVEIGPQLVEIISV